MLSNTGFAPDTPDYATHIIGSIEGRGGSGKSHLACTAPGPIAFMDLDFNSEPVRKKALVNGKEIWYAKYVIPSGARRQKDDGGLNPAFARAAVAAWNNFQADYFQALEEARTVVIDTATEAWELCRLAHFLPEWGRIEKIKAHHYTPLNSSFRNLLRAGYESDANVLLLHKVKKEWKGEGWSGKWERAGFGDIEFVSQVNLRTSVDKYGEFRVEILKCTQNPLLVGDVVEKPMNTIPWLATMVFEDSDLAAWEDK